MQPTSNDGHSRQITSVAVQQGGFITREQLRALGLTEHAIQHRISRAYLIPVLRGVYAVGHIPTASLARAHAPLLAVGARSALAGWSAVNVYQHALTWVEPFTVITPLRADPKGVTTLHTTQLRQSDIHPVPGGLRAISPALAILQVAPTLTRRRLIRLIDDFRIDLAQHLRVTHDQLTQVAGRFPRQAPALNAVLDDLQDEPTRSVWEQDWPPFATRYELPPYEMNVHVLTYRVDIRFDGLVVMLDGWGAHGSRHAFEHDREEVAEITAATGMPVIRITYRQFHGQPDKQADRILRILGV